MPSFHIPSALRPVLGAALGGIVSLGVYGLYMVSAPVVKGFFQGSAIVTEQPVSKFTEADRKARREEIAVRAREILESMELEAK